MKLRWKTAFWTSILVLLLSNLFWAYQVLDNAVGMTYYKDSCGNYQSDMQELKEILETKTSKETVLAFLEHHHVQFDSFHKADDFIIQLNSFELIYDKNGQLVMSNSHH